MRQPKKDNTELIDMRKKGFTLQQIGDKFGITRERVRQRLVDNHSSSYFLATKELAKLCQCSTDIVHYLQRQGLIQSRQNNHRGLWGLDALKTLMAYRSCEICGSLLPSKKIHYCCDACYQIGNRQAREKCMWRHLHQKAGKSIPASCDYRPDKVTVFRERLNGQPTGFSSTFLVGWGKSGAVSPFLKER